MGKSEKMSIFSPGLKAGSSRFSASFTGLWSSPESLALRENFVQLLNEGLVFIQYFYVMSIVLFLPVAVVGERDYHRLTRGIRLAGREASIAK
jgi:hypothetical protein